jgi:hypothetical protein
MKNIDLIILNKIADFQYLDNKGINIDQLLVITQSPAVAYTLKKRNLKYIFYNSLLSSKAIDENLRLSQEFLIKLAELDNKYMFMNVPIFKILRTTLPTAHINNIFLSLTIVSKILENYNVENFYFTINDYNNNQIDISIFVNDILFTKFKNSSTKIKKLNIEKKSTFHYPKIKNINSDVFKKIENDFDQKSKVLFIINNSTENEEILLKTLNENKIKNINYVLKNDQRTMYRNENDFSPLFFYDFICSKNKINVEMEKINIIKDSFYNDGFQNEINDYFLSNLFQKFFNSIFFEECIYIIKDLLIFEKILISTNPDQIVFSQSWDKSVRAMIFYAKRFNIISHVFLHGGIFTKDSYSNKVIDVDNYHVYNKANYLNLINIGQNKRSLTYLGGLITKIINKYLTELNSESSFYDHKKGFTVCFFTSDFTIGFSKNFLESVNNLIKFANNNLNVNFIIKNHPRYDIYEFWDLIQLSFPKNLRILNCGLFELINQIDIGVLFNNPSNIIKELSFAGIPIVYLREDCFSVEKWHCEIDESPISKLNSFEDLSNYINKISKNDTYLKKQKKLSTDFYREYFCNDSTISIYDFIKLLNSHKSNSIIKSNKKYIDVIMAIKSIVYETKVNNIYLKNNDFSEKENFLWVIRLTYSWLKYFGRVRMQMVYYFALIILSLQSKRFSFLFYLVVFSFKVILKKLSGFSIVVK